MASLPIAAPGPVHFPRADALRALAMLAVLFVHVSAPRWGVTWWGPLAAQLSVAVEVFFVLSGFLLYRPFVAARAAGRPTPSLRAYARRRILRIVPAYWLALTVLALTTGLPGAVFGNWWLYYGFLQAWKYNPDIGIGAAWSLSVEAAFYLVLPALAAVQRHVGRRTWGWADRELAGIALIAGASFALNAGAFAATLRMPPTSILYLGDFFALGMALAVASVRCGERGAGGRPFRLAHRATPVWLLAAGCFLLAALVIKLPGADPAHFSRAQLVAHHVLLLAVAGLAVVPIVFDDGRGGLVGRLLSARVLAWLGLISYGIFLWHGPLLRWLAPIVGQHMYGHYLLGSATLTVLLATLAVTLPIAAASFYLLERPLMSAGRRSRVRRAGASQTARGARALPPGRDD